MKKYAKQIAAEDNVATCVADVSAGDDVFVKVNNQESCYKANADIKFGHKIATKAIKTGEFVFKYSTEIGKATEDINVGDWVHIHNVVDHYEVR